MTRSEGRRLRASEPWERESLKSRPRTDLEGHSVLSLPPGHPPLHVSSPCIGMPGPGWHQWSFLWGRPWDSQWSCRLASGSPRRPSPSNASSLQPQLTFMYTRKFLTTTSPAIP